MIREVEKILREAGMPYIAVDEAKRALFHRAVLSSFHFCVYFPKGGNWLLLCGERTAKNRQLMNEWQAIFGDGFSSAYAVKRAEGIRFIDAAGNRLSLATTSQKPPVQGAVPPAPQVRSDATEQQCQVSAIREVPESDSHGGLLVGSQLAMWEVANV